MKNCNLDESYREMVEQALKIGETILERKKKEKEQEQTQNKEQSAEKITLENIEQTAEEAKLQGIQEDTQVIKNGVKEQMEMQQENNELGENIDDKSNDERA